MSVTDLLTPDEILASRGVIDQAFLDSPLMRHPGLDEALGCRLTLKVETLNPVRSFKGRGTEAVLSALSPRPSAVVAASSGNFGQGIARAASRRGIASTVFAPADANPLKVDAMRRLGATVELVEPDVDESDAARAAAVKWGVPFVEDGAHREIASGAGTIAQEMTAAGVRPEVFLVQIGDGALAGGIGSWLRAVSPKTRIIGVTAAGSPAMADSLRAGSVVERPARTIADGMSISRPIAASLALVALVVDEVLAVDEPTLLAAVRLLIDKAGLLAEPSGAAGVAALLAYGDRFGGADVAAVVTGSNLDPRLFARLTS